MHKEEMRKKSDTQREIEREKESSPLMFPCSVVQSEANFASIDER